MLRMGDYAKAVEAYKLAMGKSDGDASIANLHIGMALARSGDKAGATAALNAVTGARAGDRQILADLSARKPDRLLFGRAPAGLAPS